MRSFKGRLTLWNVAVLGIVLVAFSIGLLLSNQARASSDLNRELIQSARMAMRPGPPGGQGGQPGQRGQDSGLGPGQQGNDAGPDGPQGPQPPRQGNRPPLNRLNQFGFDQEGIRQAELRRPRRFDLIGQSRGPGDDQPFDRAAYDRAVRGASGFVETTYEDGPVRVFTTPEFGRDSHIIGVVQVARDLRPLTQLWQTQLATLLIFIPLALLLAGAGAAFLTGRAIRPIGKMREAAAEISESDLERRLVVEGDDELAELGKSFNDMVGRLGASFANLKQANQALGEAYENQRRFTADASHELRTPLTRLRLAIDNAMAPGATDQERRKAIEVADVSTRTMSRLVQELLLLAQADGGQMNMQHEAIDLRLVASDAVSALPDALAHRVTPQFPHERITAEGDSDALTRVCTNLIENALRHTPETGTITIAVEDCGDHATITVADSGEGIAPEHISRITERFYRADAARSRSDGGTGLGLAICRSIVEAHGGRLRVESQLGAGTTVTIEIPKKAAFQIESK
jgi:two-component system, OmpR family, sensor kinase